MSPPIYISFSFTSLQHDDGHPFHDNFRSALTMTSAPLPGPPPEILPTGATGYIPTSPLGSSPALLKSATINLPRPQAPRQHEDMLELGLSDSSRTISSVAKRLGRKLVREDTWASGLRDGIQATLEDH